jgi:hypothetical protein
MFSRNVSRGVEMRIQSQQVATQLRQQHQASFQLTGLVAYSRYVHIADSYSYSESVKVLVAVSVTKTELPKFRQRAIKELKLCWMTSQQYDTAVQTGIITSL